MPLLPGDPFTTASTGADLLGAAWGLGAKARDAREAHHAIGEVIAEALAVAICPEKPTDESALAAAAAIQERLRKTPLPRSGRRPRGRIGQAGERFAALLRRNRVPKFALYGESDFFVLLSQWLAAALAEPDQAIELLLGRVGCRDPLRHADLSPAVLCVYFPASFLQALARPTESKWRRALLASLRAADENRRSLAHQLGWTGLVLGPGAVGGITAVATTLSGATDHQTLYAALTALGISVPAQLLAAWRSRAVVGDPLRHAVRDAANRWLGDCRAELANPGEAGASLSPMAWIAEMRVGGKHVLVSEELVNHLARLRRAASDSGDQALAVQLFALEDRLVRARHGRGSTEEVSDALAALTAYLMSEDDETNPDGARGVGG